MEKNTKEQMKVLAIETSGATFSLALAENGVLVSEIFWHSGLTHSERLIPALDRLFTDAGWKLEELSLIAVSTGPGSFTGIRVGLSCAKTLAQNLGIPLAGMDTLELLTAAVPQGPYTVFPAIDALRDEVFVRGRKGEIVIRPVASLKEDLKKCKSPVLFVGNAGIRYHDAIVKMSGKKVLFAPPYLDHPRAGVLAISVDKSKGCSYRKVVPLYIRRSWAEEKR